MQAVKRLEQILPFLAAICKTSLKYIIKRVYSIENLIWFFEKAVCSTLWSVNQSFDYNEKKPILPQVSKKGERHILDKKTWF